MTLITLSKSGIATENRKGGIVNNYISSASATLFIEGSSAISVVEVFLLCSNAS